MTGADFLGWWFGEHWFWSTVLTPALSFAWCCWKGLVLRGIVSFVLAFVTIGGGTAARRRRRRA